MNKADELPGEVGEQVPLLLLPPGEVGDLLAKKEVEDVVRREGQLAECKSEGDEGKLVHGAGPPGGGGIRRLTGDTGDEGAEDMGEYPE